MSDSPPTGPVFPPFGPALSRPSASRPAPAVQPPPLPEPEPVAQAAPEPDLPFMAPFGGAEARTDEPAAPAPAEVSATQEEAMPWEMPSAPEAEAPAPTAEAEASEGAEEGGEDEGEDLPWLEMPASAPQARAEPAVEPWAATPPPLPEAQPEPEPEPEAEPAAQAGDVDGIPEQDWMSWSAPGQPEPDAQVEPVEVEPTVAEFVPMGDFGGGDAEIAPSPGLVPVGDMSMVAPQVEAPAPPAELVPASAADVSAAPAQAAGPSSNGHFGEVAARLERIARALREQPEAFMAGGSGDPLDLLVTGFVLGYTQRVK
jgi:hypothetical protein